jgi:16S rRNA (cytosine967-C5)-methyltransferase
MTPSARTQAAIDLLDRIINAAREGGAAADTIIARWFAERRYAGSKDRRAIRELVYDAIRLCGERPESGRAALLTLVEAKPELAATFDGSHYGPAPIAPKESAAARGTAPAWLEAALAESGLDAGQCAALLDRASLDVRINRLKAGSAEFAPPGAERIAFLADGLRLPSDTNVEKLPEFLAGQIEVQDAGSQLVTLAADARPGMHVIDLCAGAGGKTLALAAAMENRGTILASDIDRPRLGRLAPRAERAGANIVSTRLLDPQRETAQLEDQRDAADVVLIDAPCSGTGTWRRNPEARWRLTPERLARFVAAQRHVLEVAAPLVRPGGSLIYIVCSLLDAEGCDQIDTFLRLHGDWESPALALPAGTPHGKGMRLTPASDATDGFFVAKLVRPC